jgi:hypothetical protein
VIPETGLVDGVLPADVFQPIRDWLTETAQRADRRVAVLSQTMSGVLDTFKIRVPKLAAHVDAQVVLRTRLRREAEAAYATALQDFDSGTRNAQLLRGEVLARWQDYAASGDLGAALRGKRGAARKGRRARKGTGTMRVSALDVALRTALQALVLSVADQAAEQVARSWRADPAGAALLTSAEASRARGERVNREFESAFGTSPSEQAASQSAFDRSSPDLPPRVTRAVSAWQDQLMRLMQAETMSKRSGPSHDSEPLSLITVVAMLGEPSDTAGRASTAGQGRESTSATDEIARLPRELLTSAIGAAESRRLVGKARQDLAERVRLLLDEELLRFVAVLDEAGPVDPVAAVRLYQAEYSLEAAR